jgi:hypothetical protein
VASEKSAVVARFVSRQLIVPTLSCDSYVSTLESLLLATSTYSTPPATLASSTESEKVVPSRTTFDTTARYLHSFACQRKTGVGCGTGIYGEAE